MKNIDHVWVFAGGNFQRDDFSIESFDPDSDRCVAVDGGVEHCLAAGMTPHLLIGDLDSVHPSTLADRRLLEVPRQVYPTDKDASDLELALQVLEDWQPRKVSLLGVSGGRTDHMLFNWLLPLSRNWRFHMDILDSSVHAYVVTAERNLHVSAVPGQLLSVLALTDCTGVCLDGVEYPLAGATLQCGSTIGLSNRLTDDAFALTIDTGKLLTMLVR
ncbi:MAG: thiamine diphosphokinase [Granulosicoccus sp.]